MPAMLAYIGVNGSTLPAGATGFTATANPDTYNAPHRGARPLRFPILARACSQTTSTSWGARTPGPGTRSDSQCRRYVSATSAAATSFTYCGNGALSGPACATVTLAGATIESRRRHITVSNKAFTSKHGHVPEKSSPLAFCLATKTGAGYRLTAAKRHALGRRMDPFRGSERRL